MQIHYVATTEAQAAIDKLGRTEDLRLSPDNRRLAIAAFHQNLIALFDIAIESSAGHVGIALSNPRLLTSPHLRAPHGLDFIDEQHLLVANREGQLSLIRLAETTDAMLLISPRDIPLANPGSLSVRRIDERLCDVLVCDNSAHQVSRYRLDYRSGRVEHSEALLKQWLDIPDGIDLSQNQQWLAVSNHNLQNVMLYANPGALPATAEPQGLLGGLHYPHGIRFSHDARQILVADAGAPYVHLYREGPLGWHGVHMPCRSLAVVSAEIFQREQRNPQEGGPKGIDLDRTGRILAVTCSGMPLVFFDLAQPLQDASAPAVATPAQDPHAAGQVRIELQRQQRGHAERKELAEAKAAVQAMRHSSSWRLTAPLRRVIAILRRDRLSELH